MLKSSPSNISNQTFFALIKQIKTIYDFRNFTLCICTFTKILFSLGLFAGGYTQIIVHMADVCGISKLCESVHFSKLLDALAELFD